MTPSVPTLTALSLLRKQNVYAASLCDAVLLGGRSNRTNAIGLLPAALRALRRRTQAVIDALAEEGTL